MTLPHFDAHDLAGVLLLLVVVAMLGLAVIVRRRVQRPTYHPGSLLNGVIALLVIVLAVMLLQLLGVRGV